MDADSPAFALSVADFALSATTIATAVTHLPDHVVLVDRDHRLTYMNPAGLTVLGKELSAIIGQRPISLFPASVAEKLSEQYEQAFRYNQPQTCTIEFATATQGVRHYECVFAPVPGADGQPEAILGTTRDITDRQQILEELSLRDRAIAAASGGIVIVDPYQEDSPIIFANPGFEKLTGYPPSETMGRNCRFLQGPLTTPESIEQLREGIRNQRTTRVVLRNHRRDGSPFWNSLEISPVWDADGKLVHFIGVQTDITERVEAQEALARAYAREQRIAQMLQGSLLLAPPERFSCLTVVTQYHAALEESQVGGDFYDAFPLGNGKVALVVGDAAGKGLSAAAQIAEVKYALHVFLRETPDDPADALMRLNRFVYQSKQIAGIDEMHSGFVALSLAVIEAERGHGVFVAAGMDSPVSLRPGSGAMTMSSQYGVPLGVIEDAEYTAVRFEVSPGDLILLASDGITEARTRLTNADGSRTTVLLDMTGAARLLRENIQHEPDIFQGNIAALRRLSNRVLVGAREYGGGTFADDACLLIACVTD